MEKLKNRKKMETHTYVIVGMLTMGNRVNFKLERKASIKSRKKLMSKSPKKNLEVYCQLGIMTIDTNYYS